MLIQQLLAQETAMTGELLPWLIVSATGLVLSSIGGLGAELADAFAGRSLELYSRLKKNRERFYNVIDCQDDAIESSQYLRMIGTVLFLVGGTAALFLYHSPPTPVQVTGWGVCAGAAMMLVHSWLPAAVTRFASTPVLYHTWPFWRLLIVAMSPLSAPGEIFNWGMRRVAGVEEAEDEDEEQLEDEIRTMVTAGTREGYFGEDVRQMITGVMSLHDEDVKHIMTPRGEVDGIDESWTWDETLTFIVSGGRTRFPVYRDTLDNVIGVLYVKDLLPMLVNKTLHDSYLKDIVRRPWTVPIDRSVELLLREFLHSRSHMAIVLDEFQQMAGVVTIEDALEEIVGEIVDESDEEDMPEIQSIGEDTFRVDGRVMMDDVNEATAWDLPESEDYETIAGYVLFELGTIPEPGTVVTLGDVEIEVLRANGRRIEQMKLHRGRLAS